MLKWLSLDLSPKQFLPVLVLNFSINLKGIFIYLTLFENNGLAFAVFA